VFAGAPFLVMPWRSAMIDPAPAEDGSAEAAILSLLAEREAGKSICPSEAARRLDPETWRAAYAKHSRCSPKTGAPRQRNDHAEGDCRIDR